MAISSVVFPYFIGNLMADLKKKKINWNVGAQSNKRWPPKVRVGDMCPDTDFENKPSLLLGLPVKQNRCFTAEK